MRIQTRVRLTTILKRAAIAVFAGVAVAANAQSISSEMDQINAGIRARAAAAKGKEPEEIKILDSGPTQATQSEACDKLSHEMHAATMTTKDRGIVGRIDDNAKFKRLTKEYELRCLG